jgi:hypothetical protein
MAGDTYYLYLCDDKKKILEDNYLGKLRYNSLNKFSLANYRFKGHCGIYEIEERKSDGEDIYCIFTNEIIDTIRNTLLDTPLSEGEKEAHEDTTDALEWIDNMLKKYKETYFFSSNLEPGSIHVVFYTDVD